MKRSEIRDFIKAGVDKISPQLHFGSGSLSAWKSKLDKEFTQVWWNSIIEDSVEFSLTHLPFDNFPIELHISKQDRMDSLPEEYEDIIDECHYIAQQLMYQFNQALNDSHTVAISNYSRTPFVKVGNEPMTGIVMRFNLSAADTTKVC